MKHGLSILLAVSTCSVLSAGQDDSMRLLRARMARRHADVGRYVMAFYYPWYGTMEFGGAERHWGKWDTARKDAPESRRWPADGPYDSTDPKVVDRRMRQFAEAGID